MAQITVTINGRSFRMACDDGEEDRLTHLAMRFDGWISELRENFGEIGDQRLTVMAGIMATDQLAELERRVERLERELKSSRVDQHAVLEAINKHEADLAKAVDSAACRIENLASGLSQSLRPPQ